MKVTKVILRPSFFLTFEPEDYALLAKCAAEHPSKLSQAHAFKSLEDQLTASQEAERIRPNTAVPFSPAQVNTMTEILCFENPLSAAERIAARALCAHLDNLLHEYPTRNVTGGDQPRGRTELAPMPF